MIHLSCQALFSLKNNNNNNKKNCCLFYKFAWHLCVKRKGQTFKENNSDMDITVPDKILYSTKKYTHCFLFLHENICCRCLEMPSLRKHAYSNVLKISAPKTESLQIKILILFHISAQNIDCGHLLEPPQRGGSNKYPQSMFLSRNKKNNVYPCKPQFYYIKVGFKGVKII